jgi:hypothetical protein
MDCATKEHEILPLLITRTHSCSLFAFISQTRKCPTSLFTTETDRHITAVTQRWHQARDTRDRMA